MKYFLNQGTGGPGVGNMVLEEPRQPNYESIGTGRWSLEISQKKLKRGYDVSYLVKSQWSNKTVLIKSTWLSNF